MKKVLTKALLLAMTIVTLATIIPLSVNATSENKKEIYSFLTNEMGLNSAAACGILANVERESDFNPKLVIRDSNGRKSGGLFQWNGNRFSSLQNFCNKYGYNYLSIEGQMNYLKHELSLSSYKYIYDYMKDVSNSSQGAYDAGYYWCYYFEIPSNRSVKAKQRGSMAVNNYWPSFGNKTPKAAKISFATGDKYYDMDDSIKVNWTSAGSNCNSYKVMAVEKIPSTGKYDWSNVKTYSVSSSSTGYTFPRNALDGYYAIKVRAVNNATGEYKDSNYVFCRVTCSTHEYTSKITKQPTFEKKGEKLLTCKQCDYKITKSVKALTVESFKKTKMNKPTVAAATQNAIKLNWESFSGAKGYLVYQRVNGKWKLVGKTTGNSYTIKNLKTATEYKFGVRAYTVKDSKTYYSLVSPSLVTSTETDVPTISLARGTKQCNVSWSKVANADGYQIYMAEGENSRKFKKVASVSADKLKYTVTGLKVDEYYNFKVRSYVKCSNGSYTFSNFSTVKYIIAR